LARRVIGPFMAVTIADPAAGGDAPVEFVEPPSSPAPGVCVAALLVIPHDGTLRAPSRAWLLIAPAPPRAGDDADALLQQPYPQAAALYPDDANPAAGVRLDFRLEGLPGGRFYAIAVLEYQD